jgi:ABC-2 type transport system ATP-binding protein
MRHTFRKPGRSAPARIRSDIEDDGPLPAPGESMTSNEIVRIRNLTYEYPGVRALDRVDLAVTRGSVTALVGPNGAGKTTLLRCIAALDLPLEGTIEIDGVDVLEHPRECHRRIGYLSDFYGLYQSLTVRKSLTYAASSQRLPDSELENAVTRTAAELNLTNKLDELCSALSRGQRQRVAIAQALIHSPELLILDEPAAGLDPEARHELAGLFQKLRGRGMTLIVSSHILAELDEYSTHMLVMREGRIIENRELQGAATTANGGVRVRAVFAPGRTGGAYTRDVVEAAVAGVERVSLQAYADSEAVFAVPEDPAVRAAVIRALVQAGLDVVSYGEERENLHESYLRTLRSSARRDAS